FAMEKNPKVGGYLSLWELYGKGGKTNSSTHQQFSLDRAALNLKYGWLPKGETGSEFVMVKQSVDDIQWRFQAFKVYKPKVSPKVLEAISPKLGNATIKNSLRALVHDRPKVHHQRESAVYDYTFKSDSENFESRVQLTGLQDFAKRMAEAGFEEIKDMTDD